MAGTELLKQGEERRTLILNFVRTYKGEHDGTSPTIQEIAEGVGLNSPNATRNHLRRLQADGFLTMRPRVARAIELIPQPEPPKRRVRKPKEVVAEVPAAPRKRAPRRPAEPVVEAKPRRRAKVPA